MTVTVAREDRNARAADLDEAHRAARLAEGRVHHSLLDVRAIEEGLAQPCARDDP